MFNLNNDTNLHDSKPSSGHEVLEFDALAQLSSEKFTSIKLLSPKLKNISSFGTTYKDALFGFRYWKCAYVFKYQNIFKM